jgi:PAS domain S-box-containing protein
MANRDPSSPTPMPTILRYGIAVLSVAIAIGLDFFVLRHFEAILTPFLFAVAATVWYAGTGPGVLAIVLSVFSLNYFFLPPAFSFSPVSYADFVYLAFCIFCASVVGWISTVRRRAEQELRQARDELEAKVVERTANLQRSERYLAETQKLTHTGSWAWDVRSQKVLYCSEEMFRIFGLDPQDHLPTRKNFRQRVHPEDRNRVDERFARAVNERVDSFDEYRVLLPDGTDKYVSSSGHPVLDGNGELIEFIGTATDVTERKRAEEALRGSEAKIRRLVDSNIIGIFIWDFDGRILEANDEFLRMVSYDREDLVAGRIRWADLTPPDWRGRNDARIERQKSGGRFEPFEKEYTRKDGSRVPVLIGGATFEEGGNQGVAFVFDLTERKRLEERLRVQYTIAQILAEAATIEEATPRILRAMGECLGWDVGALWRVDREAEALRCVELWHKASIEVPEFERVSREFTFGPGSGLPGRVWSSLEPEYIPDVAPDENFPRAPVAEREGLRAAFGFPILLGGDVLGVIEFFSREIRQPDQELLNVLATIGSQIGQFIERRRAEVALRDSERSLRSAIDGIAGLVAIMAPNGELDALNRQVIDYFGRSLEEMKNWGTSDAVHPEDLPRIAEVFQRSIATGTPFHYELRLRRFDGEYRWFDNRCVPIREKSGHIARWYMLGTDIEDRKRAEQALRRSETYLAEAQRLSHSGVSAYNETAILYGSEETYRIWGFDPAQGVPSREAVFQRIHPDDRDRLNVEVQRAVSEKRGYSAAYRIILPDGTIKHLETIGRPAFSASGELVEIVTTQIDVTERKRAEEGLRESEAKLRDYAETASDWFWEIDPDYKFTLLTEKAFGSDPADRIGTACWDHALDLETEPEKWRLIQATLDLRKPFRDFVYCSARGDGSPMYVKASGKPVFDPSGEFCGYRGTGTDVTALRTIEAEARENEQRYREAQLELAHANRVVTMGQLTASITHEVNQPITAAITYALAARRFLSAEPPNFREVDDALSLIVKEGTRAGEVVGRIRALIKKAPARKDPVEINDAILEIIALTGTEAANNSVSVRTQLAEDLARVQGDRVQLQQVLLNLIINAIEAMRDVGEKERELLISTRNEPDGVSVEVRDSGPGFAPAALERVFEAFYTTKPGGLGLGLSICRSIIEAHNGRLWASDNVPRGAVFGFIAPVHPAAAS